MSTNSSPRAPWRYSAPVTARARSAAWCYRNLLTGGCKGACYAINPKHDQVADKPCYKSLQDLNKHLDLVLIATPATTVPEISTSAASTG